VDERKGRKTKGRETKGRKTKGSRTKGWEERSWMETPRSRMKILKVLWRKVKGSDRKKIW
jgi:hypothetical protein